MRINKNKAGRDQVNKNQILLKRLWNLILQNWVGCDNDHILIIFYFYKCIHMIGRPHQYILWQCLLKEINKRFNLSKRKKKLHQ